MEDVSASVRKKLSQNWPALSVRQGKINDELTAQIADFPFRDEYILQRQFGHGLLIAAAMDKKCIPHLNDYIKSKSASFGYEVSKLFGSEGTVAMGTVRNRLLGKKGADVHGDYSFCIAGFLNIRRRITHRAFLDFRVKM
jgi:hypothetical protein